MDCRFQRLLERRAGHLTGAQEVKQIPKCPNCIRLHLQQKNVEGSKDILVTQWEEMYYINEFYTLPQILGVPL